MALLDSLIGTTSAHINWQHSLQPMHLVTTPTATTALWCYGANLEAVDSFGWTPLIQAAYIGNRYVVATLLHLGAKVRVFDPQRHRVHDALMFVSINHSGHRAVRLLQLLLEHSFDSVDLNAADDDLMTPLIRCCIRGNVAAVTLLVRWGADVKQRGGNEARYSAVWYATEYGRADVVAELLRCGADPLPEENDAV